MFVSSGHFLAQFQQFNLISIYARNLKLFRSFLIKSLVTNYINKIGIDLVIFGLLSDVGETFINFYQFFYQFSRKVPLLVFCGANHHKCLDFLFLREICIAALWSLKKKNPSALSGNPTKNQYHTPTPVHRCDFHIPIQNLSECKF